MYKFVTIIFFVFSIFLHHSVNLKSGISYCTYFTKIDTQYSDNELRQSTDISKTIPVQSYVELIHNYNNSSCKSIISNVEQKKFDNLLIIKKHTYKIQNNKRINDTLITNIKNYNQGLINGNHTLWCHNVSTIQCKDNIFKFSKTTVFTDPIKIDGQEIRREKEYLVRTKVNDTLYYEVYKEYDSNGCDNSNTATYLGENNVKHHCNRLKTTTIEYNSNSIFEKPTLENFNYTNVQEFIYPPSDFNGQLLTSEYINYNKYSKPIKHTHFYDTSKNIEECGYMDFEIENCLENLEIRYEYSDSKWNTINKIYN